jgi:serine/threonine protein kinase
MNKTAARTDDTASQVELLWQQRVDALVAGECSEAEFMAQLSSLRQSAVDSAWSVIALLDQRYRRGQLPIELFRSIEAKISRRELGSLDYGTTIELDVVLTPPAAQRDTGPAADVLMADYPVAPMEAQPTEARHTAAPAAPVDRVLRDRYILEKQLGSGGMGTVFKAVDRYRCDLPPASRIVAIKFLHETAGEPEKVSKLRREFYCAQALSHPNIVKVYELDRDGDVEFFTMEFLDGALLSSVLEELAPASLSRPRAWTIIREVAAGLAHAHSRNVIHGDLKPQNIMVTRSGETRILDFGASSAEIAQKSNSSAMTPAYASCELLDGQGVDPRDDLFALACLSYELLSGRHPFQRRRSSVARDLGLIAERPPGLTRRQWQTLQLGLAWRREERSMSVADWISRLSRAGKPPMRTLLPVAALTLATLIVVGLAALFIHPLFGKKDLSAAAPAPAAADAPSTPAADAADPSAPGADGGTGAAAEAALADADVVSPTPARVPAPAAAAVAAARSTLPPAGARRASVPAPAKAVDTVGFSATEFRVGAHRNFAEIRVRRSNGSGSDTTFAWWTEAGSAAPGTDYVAQDRTIQLLSSRSQAASLFVKLVPNVSRKHRAVFYVVIAEPGRGTSLGRVTRAAVVLPPQ